MTNPLTADLDHILTHTENLWLDVRGERFFLTGGTGFVGTWLTESLVWANRRLNLGISAALLTRNPRAFVERSPQLAADPAVTLHTGDAISFKYPVGPFPFLIHAAVEPYFAPSPQHPVSTFDRDVAATRHMLDMARTHGTKRFLFTSSGAVYGKQPPHVSHVAEDFPAAPFTTDTNSAYAQGKRVSEFLCSGYAEFCGFDAMIARLFAFSGPHLPLDKNYAVGNFVRDAVAGGPVRILGDGTPYRSYLYAADLAIWLWTILFRGKTAYPYNVGSPVELTIADLAHRVASLAPGTLVDIAHKPIPGAPAARYVPDTTRAENELGLRAWIPLEEGLRRMVAHALACPVGVFQ
jgi:nucleoside-diphosphate-sugar epimerase